VFVDLEDSLRQAREAEEKRQVEANAQKRARREEKKQADAATAAASATQAAAIAAAVREEEEEGLDPALQAMMGFASFGSSRK
jgi:hypothetical protein